MMWGILFVGVSEDCEDSVINVYFNDNSFLKKCFLSPLSSTDPRLHQETQPEAELSTGYPACYTVGSLRAKASLKSLQHTKKGQQLSSTSFRLYF